jgi:uncharacterized membrane protein YjdF
MQVVCAFCHISYVKIPFNWFAYKLQDSNCGVTNNWKRVAKQVVLSSLSSLAKGK